MKEIQPCYYCDKEAIYTQLVGTPGNYFVSNVCKEHFKMGLSS
jgi:hypothetical protein